MGMIRLISNCSSGFNSAATSVLVVPVQRLLQSLLRRAEANGPFRSRRHPEDVDDTGPEAQEQEADEPPRLRAEPIVEGPAETGADEDGDHQLQSDAEAQRESVPTLAVTAPLRRLACRPVTAAAR